MWSFVAHTIPLYAFYALLFIDNGLSHAQVSALLAIWSTVAIIAEVPSGALADRFSRRHALIASGALQAIGYAIWIAAPGFTGFAVGFVLWGSGGALSSGTFEALLYDGLAASRSEDQYPRVIGLTTSVGLLAQVPAAVLATALFAIGGYPLVGWVSVGVCLLVALLAATLPDHRPATDHAGHDPGYFETLRDGMRSVRSVPAVRRAAIAVALLFGLDSMEEYFPLQIELWGVRTTWVPVVVLTIPLGGALGAAFAGRGARWSDRALGIMLGVAGVLLWIAVMWARPAAVIAIVGFYGVYRCVLSVAEARMQRQMPSASRATATSVAALGGELVGIAVYGVWALGGLGLITVVVIVVAVAMPRR